MDRFFIGSAISTVDPSGRIVLPQAFLQTLRRGAQDGSVVVSRHEEGHCLIGYDRSFFVEQQQGVDWSQGSLIGGSRSAHDSWLRTHFTFVENCEMSDVDQMTIGPIMRERGHIGSGVLLVGAGRRFEIWDLGYVLEHGPSDLRWVAERHLKTVQMTYPINDVGQHIALSPGAIPARSRLCRTPPVCLPSPPTAPRNSFGG